MPQCSNKVKPLLNILWNQKTKMPPIPYTVLTITLVCTFNGRSHNAELLVQALNRLQSSIYIYSSVHERKKNVVSHLLQKNWRRLLPVTQSSLTSNIRKMKFWDFQFSFKKDMLQLTEKSCEIYCLTIYAYFIMRTQVINHKLHISEVSFPDQSFTI